MRRASIIVIALLNVSVAVDGRADMLASRTLILVRLFATHARLIVEWSLATWRCGRRMFIVVVVVESAE